MVEIMNSVDEAVSRARAGEGPSLIEMKTYRWKGHSKSDAKNTVHVKKKQSGDKKTESNALSLS